MRRVPWILLTLASVFATSASAETNGVLSVVTYGAVCNGSTDDTAHFQAAAKAAADTYASTGSPVTVVYAGNCVIGGKYSVWKRCSLARLRLDHGSSRHGISDVLRHKCG